MPPFHLCSASRALYRVFVAPNVARPSTIAPITSTLRAPPQIFTAQTPIRLKSFKKKDTQRHSLSDAYTFDNAIKSDYINLIDDSGKMHRNVPFDEAMRSFNRTLNHLVLIEGGKLDMFGRPDPENPPICKVVSKMDLRLKHQKKLDLERKEKKGTAVKDKNLELNWAIAPGDLKHRVKKLQEFLLEGRKVEVLIGPKRRGRQATEEECRALLKGVRGAVEEIKGVSEPKPPVGTIGGVMTMIFQGKKQENKQAQPQDALSGLGQ